MDRDEVVDHMIDDVITRGHATDVLFDRIRIVEDSTGASRIFGRILITVLIRKNESFFPEVDLHNCNETDVSIIFFIAHSFGNELSIPSSP